MARGRGAVGVVVVLPVVALLAGCAGTSMTCVSWVDFATPADALESAEHVVVGRVEERAGTTSLYGVDAHRYRVVAEASPLKDGGAGESLHVVSTPVTCSGDDVYPQGDPLDTDEPVVLFLTQDEVGDDWRTLTPRHGVAPADGTGDLPAQWPVSSGR